MNPSRSLAAPLPETPGARLASLSLVSSQQGWTQMPTGDELIELAKAVALTGDRGAFAALFKHFAPRVKAYLMRSGVVPEQAEDLAQEAMISVWRKAASFDPARAQLSTWIFTIARNLRVDHLRRQRDPRAANAGGVDASDDEVDTLAQVEHDAAPLDEQLGAARREAAVRQALRQLAPDQLQALWLSFYDEQSHARIADEMKVPLGTVKSRIRLAVSHLRRLLDGTEP
jgi:RNA polymerase sigma-70 factor (ECF subfamily)